VTADKYPDTVPDHDPAFDTTVAHQARVYNYLLGGKDHYEADQEYAEKALAVYPGAADSAKANRAFLGRAVRFLAGDEGVSQFLDIGTGIPSPGSTHEVAQEARPDSRIVYVDFDPVVLAHARAFLVGRDPGSTAYLDADLRDPARILRGAAETLDFDKPVAVLLMAILHAIGDEDDPAGIVSTLMDALPSGSYLAITHWAADPSSEDKSEELIGLSRETSRQQYVPRSDAEIMRFFSGLELVEPGLVPVEEWRPGPDYRPAGDGSWAIQGCVAKKR